MQAVKEDPMEQATADRGPGGAATLPRAQMHAVTTSDGTEIRLTHYAMGGKGPIVLAPGYGNAARAFAVDTVPLNYVQALGERGYDVWLLDYRASPDLPASRTQFTVDDIAMRDWPAAIDAVRKHSGADSVQAMGHCVGGLSLFMAIGGGLEGVRSATFSSLAGHPIATPGNRLRAGAHLATIFKMLGIKGLNTDYDPSYLPDRLVDVVMRALPFRHVYDSAVGRRIYFIYGDVFDFSNINEPTMDAAVPSIFGISNITFFEHISRMIRKSRAVDRKGRDAYLSNLDRYRIPISFLTGEHNRMFVPQGLKRSYDLVRGANDPGLYTHHVFKDYAHLDMWLGDNAARDIFPTALAELERQDS
jgi:pimeloyl-ACP methyl ester carboxylesterase